MNGESFLISFSRNKSKQNRGTRVGTREVIGVPDSLNGTKPGKINRQRQGSNHI